MYKWINIAKDIEKNMWRKIFIVKEKYSEVKVVKHLKLIHNYQRVRLVYFFVTDYFLNNVGPIKTFPVLKWLLAFSNPKVWKPLYSLTMLPVKQDHQCLEKYMECRFVPEGLVYLRILVHGHDKIFT